MRISAGPLQTGASSITGASCAGCAGTARAAGGTRRSSSAGTRGGKKAAEAAAREVSQVKKPIPVGENCWVEADDISAVLRQNGSLLLFLKSGKAVTVSDDMTREELEKLIRA